MTKTESKPPAMQSIEEALGDHPRTKIATAFLLSDQPMTATDVVRQTGLSRDGFYNHIEDLIEIDVMEKGQKVGASQLYTINTQHPVISAYEKTVQEIQESHD